MSETSTQVTIKVQHKEDLRRFTFPRNGSFNELEKILRNIFSFSPAFIVVIKYQDDEKDWVTCSSDAELAAAFDFISPQGILKLLIPFEVTSPVKSEAPATNVNVAEPACLTPLYPVVSAPPPPVAASPTPCPPWKGVMKSWKEEKKNWKEERKNWKDQKKCQWRDWTPEERAAWIQRKEAWKNRCQTEKEKMKCEHKNWKCERKMWKHQNKLWKGCRGGQVGSCSEEGAPSAPALNEQFECRTGCPAKWRARFVKHVTAPDGAVFGPGTSFTKTWRFRNETNEPWPVGSKLLFVGKNSDQMGGPNELEVGRAVEAGQEVDVSVPLVAPSQPGSYVGFWRMADASGKRFGQRVRVQIQVQGSDTSSSSSSDDMEVKTGVDSTPLPPPGSFPNEECKSDPVGSPCPPRAGLFAQLQAMGFTDQALNMKLARKYDGDIVKIVKKLMKRHKREIMGARRRCP